jgi:hypothetical protein
LEGLKLYSENDLYSQTAFTAYYFHWAYDDIMKMPHKERVRFCEEINNINRRQNGSGANDAFKI